MEITSKQNTYIKGIPQADGAEKVPQADGVFRVRGGEAGG